MKESTTYQAILEEGEAVGFEKGLTKGLSVGLSEGLSLGRVEEVRRLILLMGEPRLGLVNATVRADLERRTLPDLEALALRLHQSETWVELLSE